MKQFLKSTAVFACVALMFCACSDDGTEDSLTASDLGLTTIKSVQPGENRAWVKWVVPSNDNIASCVLSWSSDDNGESGSMTFAATEGVMETAKDEDLQNLPAGTYTFSVKGISKSGVSSVVSSESVDVYEQSSYTKCPTPTIIVDLNGASVSWSDIPADCDGVIFYYDNGSSTYVDSEYFQTSASEPTIIEDAEPGSLFTFRTYFKPNVGLANEGLDYIEVKGKEVYEFPSTSPTAPISISTYPGENRFQVYWNVAYVADIVASYVSVDNGSWVKVEGDNLNKGAGVSKSNMLEFKGIETTGTYTVSIYNLKNTGEPSDSVTAEVTVYDEDTYKYSVAIKQDLTLSNSTKNLEIAWDYSGIPADKLSDCIGVIANAVSNQSTVGTSKDSPEQEDEAYLATLTSLPEWSYIADAQSGWMISYNTYYCPEGGLDIISIGDASGETAKNTVPSSSSPSKLENVIFIAGDYSLYVEFDAPDDATISTIKIECVNVTEGAAENDIVTRTLTSSNIKYGKNNFVAVTTADGLKIDNSYDVKIWCESSDDEPQQSAYELGESILVYDFSDFKSECASPTLSPVFGDSYPYGVEISWIQDEEDAEVDYINFTYVYNTNGDTTTYTIDDISTPTVLPDVMPGTAYSYTAVCAPASNAQDSYSLPPVSSTFPYVRVDKSLIEEYSMSGDAELDESSGYNSFAAIFDDVFSLATGTGATAMASIDKYLTTNGQGDMTLSYDLGATYKLAEFFYTPFYGYTYAGFYDTTTAYNNTMMTFSLYGTAESDPKNDDFLNRTNTDGTPDLSSWKCLLDNVSVPDLLNEQYATETDLYDYNGDYVVGVDDLYYAILNLGGLKIEIPSENRVPTRYIRLQFHTAANVTTAQESIDAGGTTDYREIFHIIELDHTHMGCDVDE